jgi:NADH-quinone oxidoreductase subunit D
LPNPVRPAFDRGERDDAVIVNIGPSHRATHGTIQVIAMLDGEKVQRVDVHCGYLPPRLREGVRGPHLAQPHPVRRPAQLLLGLINDFAYCEAVETLMGVEITPRCRYLRTLLSEYSRIADHLTCIAASLMELGAMTAFLYLVMIRDYIYEHLADLDGRARDVLVRTHRGPRARSP